MYDGIKIECRLNDRDKWRRALPLIGRHQEATGEVMNLPAECTVNACTFSRVPGTRTKRYFQGSVHRFFNKGADNDTDYTIGNFKQTLQQLEQTYGIDPRKSIVHNFEFGVNITLPIGQDAQDFQKYLVSAYKKAFDKMNPRRPMVGYIAEFNEFSIKIYDKGYQAKTGATDKIRVEIRVNRPRWLDQFGFKKGKHLHIQDLLKPVNIKILGDILENKVRSLILTPRKIDLKKLTAKQKQTFYECRDARSWEEWTSKQRERKRAQLKSIFEKTNQPNPVDVLAELVVKQWQELTTDPREPEVQNNCKKVTFSRFIVDGIRDIFQTVVLKIRECSKNGSSVFSFIVYLPRGIPPPPPIALKTVTGFKRWIDLFIRPPPANVKG